MSHSTLKNLLAELSLSVGEWHLLDTFLESVQKAVKIYAANRPPFGTLRDSDLAAARSAIFGSLWYWHSKLQRRHRDRIYRLIRRNFFKVARLSPAFASRTEFAFLTGWSFTTDWASDFKRESPEAFEIIVADLTDLLTVVEEPLAIKAFFGMSHVESRWTASKPGFDSDAVNLELSMPISFYDITLSKFEKELYLELTRLVESEFD